MSLTSTKLLSLYWQVTLTKSFHFSDEIDFSILENCHHLTHKKKHERNKTAKLFNINTLNVYLNQIVSDQLMDTHLWINYTFSLSLSSSYIYIHGQFNNNMKCYHKIQWNRCNIGLIRFPWLMANKPSWVIKVDYLIVPFLE